MNEKQSREMEDRDRRAGGRVVMEQRKRRGWGRGRGGSGGGGSGKEMRQKC